MAPVREEQDRSFYRHVLMENESVLRRCPEGSCSQVDHSACSPTVEPRWTAPHRRAVGQPSFSAEAHGRRCPEREAALELVIWTRKLVFQVLSSVLGGYWFRVWSTLSIVSSQALVCRPGSTTLRSIDAESTEFTSSSKGVASASKPPLLVVQSRPRIFRGVTRSLRYVSSEERMPLHGKVPHVEDDDDDDGPNIQEVIEQQPQDFAWWDKKVGRGSLQLCGANSPCAFDLGGGKVLRWESEKTILNHELRRLWIEFLV